MALFQLVIATQALNAMTLPLVFNYLIRLASDKALMKEYVNSLFQRNFTIVATGVIFVASILTLAAAVTLNL